MTYTMFCEDCGCPKLDMEYIPDEGVYYCPLCGARNRADELPVLLQEQAS